MNEIQQDIDRHRMSRMIIWAEEDMHLWVVIVNHIQF